MVVARRNHPSHGMGLLTGAHQSTSRFRGRAPPNSLGRHMLSIIGRDRTYTYYNSFYTDTFQSEFLQTE